MQKALEQAELKIKALNTLIDVAEDQLKIDIRKVWCQAVPTMKQDFPPHGIAVLCGLFGKSRHAYYDSLWRKESSMVKEDVILQEVALIRKELPRLGTRKLHHLLQKTLSSHQISLGRDYQFDLLSEQAFKMQLYSSFRINSILYSYIRMK